MRTPQYRTTWCQFPHGRDRGPEILYKCIEDPGYRFGQRFCGRKRSRDRVLGSKAGLRLTPLVDLYLKFGVRSFELKGAKLNALLQVGAESIEARIRDLELLRLRPDLFLLKIKLAEEPDLGLKDLRVDGFGKVIDGTK